MNPPDFESFVPVRNLGGTFRARLFADRQGNRFVVKAGQNNDHTREEVLADQLYRAAGIDVPESWYFETANGDGWRVSKFIDGPTLNQFVRHHTSAEVAYVFTQLQRGLAVDLLLGNEDVIGKGMTNIVVGHAGARPYRVDNGGALRWTAVAGPKLPRQWGSVVTEWRTWLHAVERHSVFGASGTVRPQLLKMRENGTTAALLAAAPREVRDTLEAREAWLLERSAKLHFASPTHATSEVQLRAP